MGKRGGRNQQQWEEQQWEYADYSTSRDQSWQFWPGAWSPPKGQGKQQRNEFSFPAYDDKYRTQAVAKAASFPSGKGPGKGKYAILDATEEPADPGALLTQFLQEAINATRKAEQRVRSLAATRAQKVALWNRYVEDLKRSFMKEFQRHQRDTDRITSDLQAAMQQQEQARSHLRQSWEAVARGQYPPPRESSEATDTREWDAMLQEWRTEQQETDNSHAVLRRALGMSHGGAMDVDATGRTTADELFQTPPRRAMTQAPMTPPAVDHPAGTPPGLSRTVDPYMTSPGQAAMPSPVLESSAGVPAGVTDPGGNESREPCSYREDETRQGITSKARQEAARRSPSSQGFRAQYNSRQAGNQTCSATRVACTGRPSYDTLPWRCRDPHTRSCRFSAGRKWPGGLRRHRLRRRGPCPSLGSHGFGRVTLRLGLDRKASARTLPKDAFCDLPSRQFHEMWSGWRAFARSYSIPALGFSRVHSREVGCASGLLFCHCFLGVPSSPCSSLRGLSQYAVPFSRVRNRCIGRSGASTSSLACHPLRPVALVLETATLFSELCPWGLHCPGSSLPTGPLFCTTPARARKSYIGRSGVTAWQEIFPTEPETHMWLFTILASCLVPLARGWFCCIFLALCCMLAWPSRCRFRAVGKGRSCRLPCLGCPLVVPLGNSCFCTPVLTWTTGKSLPRTRRPRKQHQTWFWVRRLMRMCWLLHLPQPVLIQPWGAIVPMWFCHFPSAEAMARSQGPDELPPASRRPHLISPETLTSQVGISFPEVPWADQGSPRVPNFDVVPRVETGHPVGPASVPDHDWLGVYVYTPHYAPVAIAVSVPRHASMQDVFDVLLQKAPGVPPGLMTCLEPIQPQRFDGYLHVIRYPSCIKGVHDGYAAIIADLSRVGGSFFATILPRNISYPDLIEFITPLSSEDEAPFRVFVGARSRPWPTEALVTLRDGDVITVTRHAHFSPTNTGSTQLADRSAWGNMEHFFSVELHSCIGVLYGSKRWCIAEHFHYGETIIDHVVRCLRLDVGRIATCTLYTPDLDIQGSHCPKLVAVQDIRPIHDTPATRARQDIFILCDLRPLGLKPAFVYSNVTTIHVPSLLSDLGVDLPSAFQVGIHGGYHFGDHVSVDYSCTLLFFVKEASGESSSDASPPARLASPVDVEDPAYSAPASEDFDAPPRASSGSIPPWVDPSVPLGHSWNSVEEFSTSVWQEFPTEEDHLNAPPGPFRSAASFGSLVRHARPLDSSEWIDHSFDDTGGTVYDSASPPELQSASMIDPPHLPAQLEDNADAVVSHGESSANHRLRAFNTYIYVPDTLPELVNASAFMPCSIDTALAAVAGARERDAVQLFPRVILASPQPDREFLVAVALPSWLQERPIVLLDCRRVNRTMFAKLLHGSLNRESLLRAAGLSCRSTWDVFVHGLLQPLGHGQRITLVSGMLITIVPCGCGAPATDAAEVLLTAGDSWDLDAVVTAPGGSPGQHFWLLTDGMTAVFEVRPGRRPTFKNDIAEHLRVQDHALTLIGVSPRIVNTFLDGIWTSGVLVATTQFQRIPCPPARRRDNRLAVVLDARDILCGLSWLTSSGPFLPTTDVTDRFIDLCPREHCVTVFGADTVTHLAERCFAVKDGTVLVVQFTEDLLEGLTPDPPPHSGGEDDEARDDSHPGEGPRTRGHRNVPPPPRNRSRTPARSTPAAVDRAIDASRPAASEEDEHTVDSDNTHPWSVKWSKGKKEDAFAEGGLSPTPDAPGTIKVVSGNTYISSSGRQRQPWLHMQRPDLPAREATVSSLSCREEHALHPPSLGTTCLSVGEGIGATWSVAQKDTALSKGKRQATFVALTAICEGDLHVSTRNVRNFIAEVSDVWFARLVQPDGMLLTIICRLLQEPTSHSATVGASWAAARTATLGLGFTWPMTGQRFILPEPLLDEGADTSDTEGSATVPAVFVLLKPGYVAETLLLHILIPQPVDTIIELVDTCRAQEMREWFPTLIPAAPQPDPRAAYILAVPEWITDQVLICIDLVPLDGRVFAAYTPSLTDKHSLLNLAGISGAAQVDLHVPGHETAVDFGVDIFVSHGMSITIAPPEAPIGPSVLLAEMLRTHLAWDERFSHDMRHHGDRFCLVADGFFRDFLLQPSRAMYYLHDIAVIFGLSTHRAALTPAAHRIGDVSIYGRSCRAVAAVSPTHSGAIRNDVIGILDCRPILEGWRKVTADQGWLDAEDVRQRYGPGSPPGYCVCLSGCKPHWRWLYIEPGQVVIVSFQPARHDLHLTVPAEDSASELEVDPGAPSFGTLRPEGSTTFPDAQASSSSLVGPDATSQEHHTHTMYAQVSSDQHPEALGGLQSTKLSCPSLPLLVGCCCVGILFLLVGLTGHWTPCILCACLARSRPSFGVVCVLGGVYFGQGVLAVQLPKVSGPELSSLPHSLALKSTRPVATPCRSRALPIHPPHGDASFLQPHGLTVGVSPELNALHTLLEEAARDPQCQAFFLAATLIETLSESDDFGYDPSATCQNSPRTISLDFLVPLGDVAFPDNRGSGAQWPAEIPHIPFSLPSLCGSIEPEQCLYVGGVSLGFTLADIQRLLQAKTSAMGISTAQGLCALSGSWTASLFAKHITALRSSCKPGELLCYTDGSFTPGCRASPALCGWACVFIDPYACQISVMAGPCDPAILASDLLSAYTGECSGLMAAALASLVSFRWRVVHFLSDCTSALAVASGTAAYTLGGIAQACRNAFGLRCAVGHGRDTFAYVPGHSGCFGNELADTLSKFGARQTSPGHGICQ